MAGVSIRACQMLGREELVFVGEHAELRTFSRQDLIVYEVRYKNKEGSEMIRSLLPEEILVRPPDVIFDEGGWVTAKYLMKT